MKQAEMPSQEVAVAMRTFQAIADDLTTFQETKEYLLSQKPQTEEEISAHECDLASIENDIARLSHDLLAKTDSFTAVIRRLEADHFCDAIITMSYSDGRVRGVRLLPRGEHLRIT